MANGQMKVHLYQVQKTTKSDSQFESLLELASSIPLQNRLRMIGRNEMRLEAVLCPKTELNRHPYWLLDFTKMRFENGPGKASRKEPIEGFDLDDDEGFGEETAALYDPTSRHILVQYNHHGPRAGSIAAYLSSCGNPDECGFAFHIRLDEASEARLASKKVIKKIQFKVATPKMTAAMRQAGVPIENVLELGEDLGGHTVEVTVTAPSRGRLARIKASKIIGALMQISNLSAKRGEAPLETLKVSGREDVDSVTEVIDMLSPVLELELDGLVLGSDRRYTQRSRWDALLRARAGWHKILQP